MGVVRDGDAVGLRGVGHGVNARHLVTPHRIDAQCVGCMLGRARDRAVGFVHFALHPRCFSVQALHDLFRQRDGGARRRVEFVHMVCFHHRDVVIGISVHDFGQIFVHGRKDSHAEREVRSPEERVPLGGAGFSHVGFVLREPTCRSAHHLDALRPSLPIVFVGCGGSRKFDGYVCRAESVGVKVGAVVDINDRNDFVSTRFGDGFDHFAHFSVSDECYFHKKGFY